MLVYSNMACCGFARNLHRTIESHDLRPGYNWVSHDAELGPGAKTGSHLVVHDGGGGCEVDVRLRALVELCVDLQAIEKLALFCVQLRSLRLLGLVTDLVLRVTYKGEFITFKLNVNAYLVLGFD